MAIEVAARGPAAEAPTLRKFSVTGPQSSRPGRTHASRPTSVAPSEDQNDRGVTVPQVCWEWCTFDLRIEVQGSCVTPLMTRSLLKDDVFGRRYRRRGSGPGKSIHLEQKLQDGLSYGIGRGSPTSGQHPAPYSELSDPSCQPLRNRRPMSISEQHLGRVKSGRTPGKTYEVKWSPGDQCVYVRVSGWTYVGKASSAGDAMRKAEAYAYDR
jgi:hypothetical protein